MPRYDPPRSLIALLATVIATAAAVAVGRDGGMSGHELAAGVFSLEAIVCGALAALPSGASRWSTRRRGFASVFTSGSIVAGLVLVVFTGARAACGCGDPTTGYSLPVILGIASTTWTDLATFGVPILIAIAGSDVPDRLRRQPAR
jgi:hypothetical protein